MTDHENVLQMELSAPAMLQVLRDVAVNSDRVFFTVHAEARMQQRGINRGQVLRCLKHGVVVEGPARDVHGKWVATLEVLSAGDVVSVVAALDNDGTGNLVVIITVYC